MTVEVFLGGLASLTFAVILIVALTSTRRESVPPGRSVAQKNESKSKRSDR